LYLPKGPLNPQSILSPLTAGPAENAEKDKKQNIIDTNIFGIIFYL
jgi:hypothetical protein